MGSGLWRKGLFLAGGVATIAVVSALVLVAIARSPCQSRADCGEDQRCIDGRCRGPVGASRSGPTFSVWRSDRTPDGAWSEPRLVIDEWPSVAPQCVYYGGWIFVERGDETLRILNPQGPPTAEARALVAPLFELISRDPAKVVTWHDGETVALFMSDERGGVGHGDLFVSRLRGGTWSAPRNIGPPVNSRMDEVDSCLTSDGRTLYFSADRGDGPGGEDIHVSRWLDDVGRWSSPQLVRALSSPLDDFPYALSPDDRTMYLGIGREARPDGGEAAIYEYVTGVHVAEVGEDGRFGTPRPVSEGVNAAQYDDFLHVTDDGRTLFFVSSRLLETADGAR